MAIDTNKPEATILEQFECIEQDHSNVLGTFPLSRRHFRSSDTQQELDTYLICIEVDKSRNRLC